jgi:ABC-type sugar transport system permease subunit
MLIFLAGLQSISPSIYEACRIDGATGWETFWKVTFPMISPMILVNSVYTIIDAFTRSQNKTMLYISEQVYGANPHKATAMYWIYFLIIMLIIAVVAAIASSFIFYQRKD